MGKLKIWAGQEDEILIKVSHMIKSKKWKKASQELKKAGFERSDVECRQRFINHLDPTVNKELWSNEQLEILYAKYDEYGNKWFLLQKHLPGRTQTKIKNYFYGNIRYLLKIIVKYFFKKSTGFINDIKTEILLDMYEGKNNFSDDNLIHRTIKRLQFRVEKKSCQKLIRQNQDDFYNFTQKFLNNQNEKSESISEEECYQDTSRKELIKIECQVIPIIPKVEVVCSTGGQIDDKRTQMEYLKMMATNHLKWYEFYHNSYLTLMGSLEEKSSPQ